ncbi:MAG: GLPGLI family protein, partial [Polaribacter sp.]
CKLATSICKGRFYEAWFTEDVPIVDGPYKFTGLPGLIVNIYDTKKEYNFLLTGLIAKKGDFPKISTKGVIEIEKNQIKKIKEGAKQNILNMAIGDSRDKFKKVYKAKNKNVNPIELENK